MFNKETFAKAVRIKGYGSYDRSVRDYEVRQQKTVRVNGGVLKVQPTVIRKLSEYIDFISSLETSYANPVFYRGQTNADFLLIPNSLRVNPKNENVMIELFTRRFQNEIDACRTSVEKLTLMQHFQLSTRCMDISESPLMALYFACSHMKKFRKKVITPEEEDWGEIILFREPEVKDCKRPENLKTVESSGTSIIASTAFMDEDFSLWHLGARWKRDVDTSHDECHIDLRTVVRRSYIVRVPQNNPRIKNQQGAFILANANTAYFGGREGERKKLTELILKEDFINYYDLQKTPFGESEQYSWNLHFQKVMPYSGKNEIDVFNTDPFDLERLFYKKDGVQQVVLIPPEAKQGILKELAHLNITEDFVYPDMDNVANEINEKINV